MPADERLLQTTPDAPWLPPGGQADVFLTDAVAAPEPTAAVRLLLTHRGRLLAVPRASGGLDVPTRWLGGERPEAGIAALVREVLGRDGAPSLVGFVRNVVAEPVDGYAFPTPHAHFCLWHLDVSGEVTVDDAPAGTWLDADTAARELHERHWWPVAASVLH